MKNIIIIAIVFVSQLAHSQVKKNVGEFDKVSVFDQISVTLVPSDEERIEISGIRSDEVEVVNKNGELKIRMTFNKLLNGEEISAILYFKTLSRIDASEGSFIGCDKTIMQGSIDVTAKEGGEVKLSLDVQKADVKSVTGGIITLSGKSVNQHATIGTGGMLKAKALETLQTTVSISAGGVARVSASVLVDAKVTAGGTITIYGKPKRIEQKVTLGGTVESAPE